MTPRDRRSGRLRRPPGILAEGVEKPCRCEGIACAFSPTRRTAEAISRGHYLRSSVLEQRQNPLP